MSLAQRPTDVGPQHWEDRQELEAILADLKAWLPGAWDSWPQIHRERLAGAPPDGEHEHWHRSFALIDAPQVGEVVFYGQINLGGRDGPVLPRTEILYKAWIDDSRNAVVINGQPPADAHRYRNLQDRPELWGEVRMRDPDAIHCDFVWHRAGRQIVGRLAGKTADSSRYGPGTCRYIAGSGLEFYADAEWILGPEELWIYDINYMGDHQFIGRGDRTFMRLYRARPYRCRVVTRDGSDRVVPAHDRGHRIALAGADAAGPALRLLRAWYDAPGGIGLSDELRLIVRDAQGQQIAMATAPPLANSIRLAAAGLDARCERQPAFPPMQVD